MKLKLFHHSFTSSTIAAHTLSRTRNVLVLVFIIVLSVVTLLLLCPHPDNHTATASISASGHRHLSSISSSSSCTSCWDGYKFIVPHTDPAYCVTGTHVIPCNDSDHTDKDQDQDQRKLLWRHDEYGRLLTKYNPTLCLSYTTTVFGKAVPEFQPCDPNIPPVKDDDDAQIWTRTSSGRLVNKETDMALIRQSCYDHDDSDHSDRSGSAPSPSPLLLLDVQDIPFGDGCDQWSIRGVSKHDTEDYGSIYFHSHVDIYPSFLQQDYNFASSVSINHDGTIVVVSGTTLVTEGWGVEYAGTVTLYERALGSSNDEDEDEKHHDWVKKGMYTLLDDNAISAIKPKVEVAISGDGKTVAIAVAVSVASVRNDNGGGNSGTVQVLHYDSDGTNNGTNTSTDVVLWTELGSAIQGSSSGELSGLKVDLNHDGNTLVIGSPYYDATTTTSTETVFTSGSSNHDDSSTMTTTTMIPNAGRVRIYQYDPKSNTIPNEYVLEATFEGENREDLMGSAVSINDDGDLIAYGTPCYDGHFPQQGQERTNAGRVRVLKRRSTSTNDGAGTGTHTHVWEHFGPAIHGDDVHDKAGFSVKIVDFIDNDDDDNNGANVNKSGTGITIGTRKVRLAVGAIYNNGNDQINSGHVRVFECDILDMDMNMDVDMDIMTTIHENSCTQWTQIGSDIDGGDNGAVFGGNSNSYHVGDAFGFSLDMSEKGDTLVVSAPFHSALRISEYYSGSVKLYAFQSSSNGGTVTHEWEQMGHDIIGDTTAETLGYSVALSHDGRTLIVGSPAEPYGSAQIYSQEMVSNSPSMGPSVAPTVTARPSGMPTIPPTVVASSQPSPVSMQSFQIRTDYRNFDIMTFDPNRPQRWCIEASAATTRATLHIRLCDGDGSNHLQRWYQDANGRIRLERNRALAITYEGRILRLGGGDHPQAFTYSVSKKAIYTIKENPNENAGGAGGIANENLIHDATRQTEILYIGINPERLFSNLCLFKDGTDNESIMTWHFDWLEEKSESPSMGPSSEASSRVPTQIPSQKPSQTYSEVPSQKPSQTYSEVPSQIPSQTYSEVPSQIPSQTSSEVPSQIPSQTSSEVPSQIPSQTSSEVPSQIPSQTSSEVPSQIPSQTSSEVPSQIPSQTYSEVPSQIPSQTYSEVPSQIPSQTSSEAPSQIPSQTYSQEPSRMPSRVPSQIPSQTYSQEPSQIPTSKKRIQISSDVPSERPSQSPSVQPVSSAPSSISSIVSSIPCMDSPLKMKIEDVMRPCTWVVRRPKICKIQGVPSHCPVACNAPEYCDQDSIQVWRVDPLSDNEKGNNKKCDPWVKRKPAFRCTLNGVRDTCRSTCTNA